MFFTNSSSCPAFQPNAFRKSMCTQCQCKIQDHGFASEKEIADAIEYSADNVPSLIWTNPNAAKNLDSNKLFMGGFKSAINIDFLIKENVTVIICAAKDLDKTFGPKYRKQIEKRSQTLPHIQVIQVDWIDTSNQKLDKSQIKDIVMLMQKALNQSGPSSVLVHCAQGKSRSAVICISYLSSLRPTVAISEIAKEVKSKRDMAEPNPGFMEQLNTFQKE
jgi:protein-tyrosine phosphatase